MERELKTELRKLLTGRTIRDEEGWLVAIPDGGYLIYHGVTDRTGYRKIKLVEKRVQIPCSHEEAFPVVLDALMNVGLLVNMETKPEALCGLCRLALTKAVILCVEPAGEGELLVQAYTGRSLTAGICCRTAISRFVKKMNQKQET